MSKKYIIYCTDEVDKGFKVVWGDNPPSECPNDAGHSVNLDSVIPIGSIREALRISNIDKRIKSKSKERVIVFQFNPTILGQMRNARILATVRGNTTSYTLELLNLTTRTTIIDTTVTDLSEDVIIDIGTVTNSPTEECVIELNVSRSNGSGQIIFNEIVIYVDDDVSQTII